MRDREEEKGDWECLDAAIWKARSGVSRAEQRSSLFVYSEEYRRGPGHRLHNHPAPSEFVVALSLPVALLLLTVMTNSWFIVFSYMSEGRGGEIQEGITVDLSVLVDQHRKQRQQSTIGYHFPVRGNGEVVSDFLNLLNIAIQDI